MQLQIIYLPWNGDLFRGTWRHTATAAALSCLVSSPSAVCTRASSPVSSRARLHTHSIIWASLCLHRGKRETCECFSCCCAFYSSPQRRWTSKEEPLDYILWVNSQTVPMRREWKPEPDNDVNQVGEESNLFATRLLWRKRQNNVGVIFSHPLELQLHVDRWAIFFLILARLLGRHTMHAHSHVCLLENNIAHFCDFNIASRFYYSYCIP